MIDFVAKIIGSGSDFPMILTVVFVYLALLWFMFSFWVYVDAKKRYNSTIIAIIFFFAVLIFNFPSLVFYLIVRPDNDDFIFYNGEEGNSRSGVNVPIVNFVGQDGKVQLSLELKIANSAAEVSPDMSIDVAWKSPKETFKVEEIKKEQPAEKENIGKSEPKKKLDFKKHKDAINSSLRKAKSRLGKLKPKFSLPKKTEPVTANAENATVKSKDKAKTEQ